MGLTAIRQRFRSAVGCLLCILSMFQCFNVSMFLVACSSDEELEVVQVVTPEVEEPVVETAITFSGHEEEEQLITRAGTPLSESATSFKVWGYKNMDYNEGTSVYSGEQTVFPGYTVTWYSNSAASTTSNSSNWEYVTAGPPAQTIKFWDWSAAAYRFYAVTGEAYDADEDGVWGGNEYKSNATASTHEIVLQTDATSSGAMAATPFFTRLWFSTGKLPEYASRQFGKPVVLEFLKPYARVRFIFKYVYPREGIMLSDVGFKPSDGSKIARKGTVTVSYPLTGTDIKESYTTTANLSEGTLDKFSEDYDPENEVKVYTETDNGWYVVVPNNAQGSYTLSVNINGGIEAKTAVVPEAYMQWLPGYSYTYIFKILDEGGVKIDLVETAVTPWTEMNATHAVYNW